jgi:pentatricopeptide repeat protein
VELDSAFHQAHLELAIAYEDQGRFEDAVDAYQRAIRANPEYVLARYNLGLLYTRLGRISQAVEQYEGVIAVDPGFADAYAGLAWLLAKQGVRQQEGFDLIEKAIRLEPEKNWYQDVLAEQYISRGEMDKAREIFREMIRREPGNGYWRERLEKIENLKLEIEN